MCWKWICEGRVVSKAKSEAFYFCVFHCPKQFDLLTAVQCNVKIVEPLDGVRLLAKLSRGFLYIPMI